MYVHFVVQYILSHDSVIGAITSRDSVQSFRQPFVYTRFYVVGPKGKSLLRSYIRMYVLICTHATCRWVVPTFFSPCCRVHVWSCLWPCLFVLVLLYEPNMVTNPCCRQTIHTSHPFDDVAHDHGGRFRPRSWSMHWRTQHLSPEIVGCAAFFFKTTSA